MDPNATLLLLRDAVREARTDVRTQGYVNLAEVEVILDLTEALDGWLSSGGFLPDAWRPEKRTPRVGVVRSSQLGNDWRPSAHLHDPNDVPGWEG